MVLFAGLPGTGKSLLVHQLVHLARARGRTVELLQWDVARPALEASPAGRRFPLAGGVTHAVIRKAAGLWVRRALREWGERRRGAEHLLIGETPLIGGRFVELAQVHDDGLEPLLTAPACRFVIALPSPAVRAFLEAERERRAASPLHPREREDAPPDVLRALWREIAIVAAALGMPATSATYDPDAYRRVYETVLRHRNVDVVPLDVVLPTRELSVYAFASEPPSLVPTTADAAEVIAAAERRHLDHRALEREIARWWEV